MKLRELTSSVEEELNEEQVKCAKALLKQKRKEIKTAEKILVELEKSYEDLLDKDLSSFDEDFDEKVY